MADDRSNHDARLGGERIKSGLPPEHERDTQKQSKNKKRFNALFNVLIVAFIGFAFFSYMKEGGDVGVVSELGELLDVVDAPQNSDPRIDSLEARRSQHAIMRFNPLERLTVEKTTLKKGAGLPILCGQMATYQIITGYGSEQEISKPRTFRLGSKQVPHGLSIGIEGMKTGEVRRLSIPQQWWDGTRPSKGATSALKELRVELNEIAGVLPASQMPLRRFTRRHGSGYPLRCGDLAVVHLTFWDASGAPIYSTKAGDPIHFFIGEGTVPYALEQGVTGMKENGKYSLVVAPEYWQRLNPSMQTSPQSLHSTRLFPQDLALPKDQLILVDIEYPKLVSEQSTASQPAKKVAPAPQRVLPAMQSPDSEPVVEPVIAPTN